MRQQFAEWAGAVFANDEVLAPFLGTPTTHFPGNEIQAGTVAHQQRDPLHAHGPVNAFNHQLTDFVDVRFLGQGLGQVAQDLQLEIRVHGGGPRRRYLPCPDYPAVAP